MLFPLKFSSVCSWFVIFSDVYVMCASPHKSWVCAGLFPRLPSRLHACLLVQFNIPLSFCYAGLYSAITSRIPPAPVQFAHFCFALFNSAAWLRIAQLVERHSAVRVVVFRTPSRTKTQGLKITEDNELAL